MDKATATEGGYFALTRLFLRLRGTAWNYSENCWLEAWTTGILIYFVGYTSALGLLLRYHHSLATTIGLLAILFIAAVMVWLMTLHFNSLVIDAIRAVGFWREKPNRRAQSVLLILTTTMVAALGIQISAWTRWVAAGWLGLVALNTAAGVILRLLGDSDDES